MSVFPFGQGFVAAFWDALLKFGLPAFGSLLLRSI